MIIYKKYSILSYLTILLFVSCDGLKKDSVSGSRLTRSSVDVRVEKELEYPVSEDFFQITNLSNAKIIYRQGDYSVVAKGDSASLSYLSIDFDGGILTLITPMESNNDYHGYLSMSDMEVYVSCPDLRAMALCGGGGFESDTLKCESLQLGGLVSGSISVDFISCKTFRYDSNGSTSVSIGRIESDESTIISTGSGNISMDIKSKTKSYLDLKGSTTFSGHVESPDIESFIETEGSVSLDVQTDDLRLSALQGSISLNGHATNQDIHTSNRTVISNQLK